MKFPGTLFPQWEATIDSLVDDPPIVFEQRLKIHGSGKVRWVVIHAPPIAGQCAVAGVLREFGTRFKKFERELKRDNM
jgi:hypothetical protein